MTAGDPCRIGWSCADKPTRTRAARRDATKPKPQRAYGDQRASKRRKRNWHRCGHGGPRRTGARSAKVTRTVPFAVRLFRLQPEAAGECAAAQSAVRRTDPIASAPTVSRCAFGRVSQEFSARAAVAGFRNPVAPGPASPRSGPRSGITSEIVDCHQIGMPDRHRRNTHLKV
jgi:hypothetical protein